MTAAAEECSPLEIHTASFQQECAQMFLRARTRRRARMTPDELGRDIARELAEKSGDLRVPPPRKWGGLA